MQGRESSVSQALVATKIHSCIMWEGLTQGDCDRDILSRLEDNKELLKHLYLTKANEKLSSAKNQFW